MRIPVPWPAPKANAAFPKGVYYFELNQEINHSIEPNAFLIVDLFTVEGFFIADWESRLWDLLQLYPASQVILHVTAPPPALLFPDSWGVKGYLVHGPTWKRLHRLSAPKLDPEAPFPLRRGWQIISPAYVPPLEALESFNAFLQELQAWRRKLSAYQPQKSSLFYTMADRLYTHFSMSELSTHVAALRG